jgi:GT2 family glycosyltransferase
LKTAVVILNYNGLHFLKKFLPFLIKNTSEATIIIADNASTDGSKEFIAQNFSDILFIQLEKNVGFASGYNQAMKQLEGYDYVVFLNSDVEVTANWLSPLIAMLDNNPAVAACQPKILDYHNRDTFEYAGASGGFLDIWGYPFCRGRIFDTLEKDEGQYDESMEVFWTTGACMIIRADVFNKMGGFDDRFFAHLEEVDLCWRIKNEGLRLFVEPKSVVYHVGGGTLNKSNPKKTFLNFRNSLLMLQKNLPKSRLFSTLLLRLILDGMAGMKFLLSGNFRDTIAIVRAHFSFYSLVRNNNQRPTKLPEGIFKESIVFNYFVKRKKKFSELFF